MSLKVRSLIAFFLVASFASSSAFAGGMEGGGGKSVVCRNTDGTIRSAEVLDLYEGRTVYELPYQESPREWQEQVLEIFKAASVPVSISLPPSGIYDWYLNAIAHLVFLPDGTSLKPIDDSFEVIVPRGCSLEQAVNYQNDRRILVDGEVWRALSETQKAALLIHEAVYRVLRSHGETDSRRARHLTAHIVSGKKIESTFPGNGYELLCQGGSAGSYTSFYAVKVPAESPDTPAKARLYFDRLGGRKLMSRAYVELGVEVIEQLRNPSQWIRFMQPSLQSLFEPGDTFDLWFHNNDGNWKIQIVNGTSAVDGSTFGPIDITCYK